MLACYAWSVKREDHRSWGRCAMLERHNTFKATIPDASPLQTGEASTTGSPVETSQPLLRRLWRIVKRYPIPFGSGALLAGSLVLWLAGRGDLANWTLLVVVLLGGAPAVVGNISAVPAQGVQRRRDRRSRSHRLPPVGRIPGGRLRGLDAFRGRSPGSLCLAARAPTTMPLDCASARYSNCLASILPASR
jgi:hypothetical protein